MDAVLDVVGGLQATRRRLRARSSSSRIAREQGIFPAGAGCPQANAAAQTNRQEQAVRHGFLPASGRGNSGGRSADFSFLCVSISETSSAGEIAETGTLPDSAPQ